MAGIGYIKTTGPKLAEWQIKKQQGTPCCKRVQGGEAKTLGHTMKWISDVIKT
jgi:hypothetical protein